MFPLVAPHVPDPQRVQHHHALQLAQLDGLRIHLPDVQVHIVKLGQKVGLVRKVLRKVGITRVLEGAELWWVDLR